MKLMFEFVQPMPLMIWAAIFIEVCTPPLPRRWPGPGCPAVAVAHGLTRALRRPQALEASVQHLADDWIDVAVLLVLQMLNVFLGFFEELKV